MTDNTLQETYQDILETLCKARDLISDPSAWIKGNHKQKSAQGHTRYCAAGAIWEATGDALDGMNCWHVPAYNVLDNMIYDHYRTSVTMYNDHHRTTHQDILDMFDEAIKQAESKAGVTL